MEEMTDILGLLDLMTRPGFCVKENIIVKVNAAARNMTVSEGTDIHSLLLSDKDEYDAFDSGCLCLTLSLSGIPVSAAVTRMGGYSIFVLEQDADNAVFNAMALISRELRKPLDNVMQLTDQLFDTLEPDSPATEQTARLNRGLYQILRIVSNLSYPASGVSTQEVRDVGSIVDEAMSKAQMLLSGKNLQLSYERLSKSVYTLVDAQLLERALLNLLSNAVKFTPHDGHIHVSFVLRGKALRLQVLDSGSGIDEHIKNDLFYRYLRQPGLEDSRYGLGLGMVLVRSFAEKHGGVVLVDKSEAGGSRITLTMSIRRKPGDRLQTPMNFWMDYAGGRDHALVELSDCLDAEFYDFTV